MLWEYSNYHLKYILQNVKSQSPKKENDFTQYLFIYKWVHNTYVSYVFNIEENNCIPAVVVL